MSFYYQFPQPRRYRGRMNPYHYRRMLSVRAAKLALVLVVLVVIGVLFFNSRVGRNMLYAKARNLHIEVGGIGM